MQNVLNEIYQNYYLHVKFGVSLLQGRRFTCDLSTICK